MQDAFKRFFSFKWLKNAVAMVREKFKRKWIFTSLICLGAVALAAVIAVMSISIAIKSRTKDQIISAENSVSVKDVDYIVILGAGLRDDGTPSDMLADRLTVGVSLLEKHPDAKLLLTGDNNGDDYNEVAAMKKFVLDLGVEEDRIVEDGKGYSTYESIYRAKNEFDAETVIIVTQKYHLYRALYISEQMGIESYGVSADTRKYRGQVFRDLREHVARTKDFFCALVSRSPENGGKM